jgi:hypothetical protein
MGYPPEYDIFADNPPNNGWLPNGCLIPESKGDLIRPFDAVQIDLVQLANLKCDLIRYQISLFLLKKSTFSKVLRSRRRIRNHRWTQCCWPTTLIIVGLEN